MRVFFFLDLGIILAVVPTSFDLGQIIFIQFISFVKFPQIHFLSPKINNFFESGDVDNNVHLLPLIVYNTQEVPL